MALCKIEECHYSADPPTVERVQFCIRFDWPSQPHPIAYTIRREDVAHFLAHEEDMKLVPSDALKFDISSMMEEGYPERPPAQRHNLNHDSIQQALFYLCIRNEIYKEAGGIPTVDFAMVYVNGIYYPSNRLDLDPWPWPHWWICFGRQEPEPGRVRMIDTEDYRQVWHFLWRNGDPATLDDVHGINDAGEKENV